MPIGHQESDSDDHHDPGIYYSGLAATLHLLRSVLRGLYPLRPLAEVPLLTGRVRPQHHSAVPAHHQTGYELLHLRVSHEGDQGKCISRTIFQSLLSQLSENTRVNVLGT